MSVIVKSRPDAVVYTRSGWRIPSDSFVEIDATAGVIKAIQNGDLEEAERIDDDQSDLDKPDTVDADAEVRTDDAARASGETIGSGTTEASEPAEDPYRVEATRPGATTRDEE